MPANQHPPSLWVWVPDPFSELTDPDPSEHAPLPTSLQHHLGGLGHRNKAKHKKEIQKKNDQEGRSKTLSLSVNNVIASIEIPKNLQNNYWN